MGMCEWGTYPFYDAAVDRTIRMSNQNKTKTVHGIVFVVEATSCLSSAAAAFGFEDDFVCRPCCSRRRRRTEKRAAGCRMPSPHRKRAAGYRRLAGCRRRTEKRAAGYRRQPYPQTKQQQHAVEATSCKAVSFCHCVAFATMATSVKAALLSHAVAYGIIFHYNESMKPRGIENAS